MRRLFALLCLVVIAAATLTNGDPTQPTSGGLCVICGALGGVDAVLNVLLFAPLGIALALMGMKPWRAILGMLVLSAAIETLQATVLVGRDPTLGDVAMNTLGGALGWWIGANWRRLLRPARSDARRFLAAWLVLWLAVQGLAVFALQPRPTESTYYGQLMRALGHPAYPGRVLSASVGGVRVPDWNLRDYRPVAAALSSDTGATLATRFESLDSTRAISWEAGVVQIMDARHRSIIMLAARDSSLIFGIRSGAQVLRVRPPLFRATHVFSRRDTVPTPVDVTARYALPHVRMDVRTPRAFGEFNWRVSAASAWRMVTPVTIYDDGTWWGGFANAAWMFLLLVPAGRWWRASETGIRGWLGVVAVTAIGTFVLPFAFGRMLPSVAEVVGAAGGLAVGWVGAVRSVTA